MRVGFIVVLESILVACSSGAGSGAGVPTPGSLGSQGSEEGSSSTRADDDEEVGGNDTSSGNVETTASPSPGCTNGIVEPGELCFFEPIYTDGIPGATWVSSTDFDADGNLDLAIVARKQGAVYVLFGDGTGKLFYDQFYDVGPQPTVAAIGAFDVGTFPDLVTANVGDGSLSVLVNGGTGQFAAPTPVSLVAAPTLVAVADFDADGFSDLAVAHDDDMAQVSLLRSSDGGLTQSGTVAVTGGKPLGVTAADVDGDGIVDLVVGIDVSNEVAILHGDGLGGFSETARFPSGGEYPIALRVIDLDANGTPEILVGNRFPAEEKLGNLQVAAFDGFGWVSSQLLLTEGAGAIDVGDFDADGDFDVVLTTLQGGSVQVFVNEGMSMLSPGQTYALTAPAEPLGVVAADFDGNGAWDFVVADPMNDRIALFVADS